MLLFGNYSITNSRIAEFLCFVNWCFAIRQKENDFYRTIYQIFYAVQFPEEIRSCARLTKCICYEETVFPVSTWITIVDYQDKRNKQKKHLCNFLVFLYCKTISFFADYALVKKQNKTPNL